MKLLSGKSSIGLLSKWKGLSFISPELMEILRGVPIHSLTIKDITIQCNKIVTIAIAACGLDSQLGVGSSVARQAQAGAARGPPRHEGRAPPSTHTQTNRACYTSGFEAVQYLTSGSGPQ